MQIQTLRTCSNRLSAKTKNYANRHQKKKKVVFQMIIYQPPTHPIPEPSHKEQTGQTTVLSQTVNITAPWSTLCHQPCLRLSRAYYLPLFIPNIGHSKQDRHQNASLSFLPTPPPKQFGQRATKVGLKMWSRKPSGFLRLFGGPTDQNCFHHNTMMLFTLPTLIPSQVQNFPGYRNRLQKSGENPDVFQ